MITSVDFPEQTHKRLLFSNKWDEHVYFNQTSRDLARKLMQSECWAAVPPKKDSRPYPPQGCQWPRFLPLRTGLGARPWQRENYDRSHDWQAKLVERATLSHPARTGSDG